MLGGVQAIFEMPNTDPNTITAETVADKVKRAHHRMHCDFAFYVAPPTRTPEHLGGLEMLSSVAG